MVQEVVLGKRPKFLRLDVDFVMPEGDLGRIRIDYVYRTRREFADFVDDLIEKASDELQRAVASVEEVPPAKPATKRASAKATKTAVVQTPAPVRTERMSVDEAIGATTNQLLEIIVGWNLSVPLSLASLDQLCNEFPGAAQAISQSYRKGINQGHSGN